MNNNFVYWPIRILVFVLATITAAIVLSVISGVVFTMLIWSFESVVAATAVSIVGWTLFCKFVGRLYRRSEPVSMHRVSSGKFWIVPVIFAGLISAFGFLATVLPPTPILAVFCLRPLGSWSVPFLLAAVDNPEATFLAESALQNQRSALKTHLPRLVDQVQKNQYLESGGPADDKQKLARDRKRSALNLISYLEADAAEAVPALLEDVRQESLQPRKNYGDEDLTFYRGGLEEYDASSHYASSSWKVLIRIGAPAVPAVSEALGKSVNTREMAILATILKHIGPQARQAVPVLVDLLKQWQGDDDKRVCRILVIDALDGIGSEAGSAVPFLIQSAKANIYRESEAALVALGGVGSRQNGAVDFLVGVVESDGAGLIGDDGYGSSRQSDYVMAAITSLARINPDGREALVAFLSGANGARVAWALADNPGTLGPDGVAALRKGLDAANPNDRFEFACAIEKFAGYDDQVIGTYIDELEINDYLVIPRLAKLGPLAKAAIPKLTQMLSEKYPHSRWSIAQAIWAIGQNPETIRPAILELLQAEDPGKALNADSLQWLKQTTIAPETIVDALLAGLQTSDKNLNERVWALTGFPPYSRRALPEIRKLFADGKIGESTHMEYLWSLSIVETVRYSLLGKICLFAAFCVICLMFECFYFRWQLRRSPGHSGNKRQIEA